MTNSKTHISPRLRYLIENNKQHLLCNGLKGIEKESLRISKQGMIAATPHPHALGSALTHPSITTDYSEALLEFITEPFSDIKQTLASMRQIHQFVYQNLDNEMLLAASMPCGINGDDSIPIAEYGSSNIGKMKHVYRKGLWHRYGRTMQAIAGIHFNYSVPKPLWQVLKQQADSPLSLDDFISKSYFGLIRNFQRQGWFILYLFGASPAICKSFFKSRPHLMSQFVEFDKYTLHHPQATSLRMSDIGYKSKNQASLKIDYNSLDGYVDSLTAAMNEPYDEYEKIGVKVGDDYNQLSSNVLQIENEFYNTIRPKQITESGEKPTLALKRRGVEYIEIRSLDLDLFNPIGIDENKARFIEAFLLHCLLQDSPLQVDNEQAINNSNQLTVAHAGRQENTVLNRGGEIVKLRQWARDILDAMQPVCEILDAGDKAKPYTAALESQRKLVADASLTPSAKILAKMQEREIPFGRFGLDASAEHEEYFKSLPPLDDEAMQGFKEMATKSHQKQKQIEMDDDLGFDEFLANYFAQK